MKQSKYAPLAQLRDWYGRMVKARRRIVSNGGGVIEPGEVCRVSNTWRGTLTLESASTSISRVALSEVELVCAADDRRTEDIVRANLEAERTRVHAERRRAEREKERLAEAVRLTADAVIEAADAWWNERWAYKRIDQKEDALREAVLAHRKAKAAQQEASRG
ncbi:MAG: hypothetical protein EKK62_09635 [Acidimicrobiia bacterium]|nr:MAG: hypothetical protein EKK62_09635 [Acidimicrobiia bacterium]